MSFPDASGLISEIDAFLKANVVGCGECKSKCNCEVSRCRCLRDCKDFSAAGFDYNRCEKHRYLYICKYLIAHKFDIYSILKCYSAQIRQHLGNLRSFSCLSFGGGPGTDLVGLLQWLYVSGIPGGTVNYVNFDKNASAWNNQIKKIRDYYEPKLAEKVTVNYKAVTNVEQLERSEVIICSYVINELRRDSAKINLPVANPGIIILNDVNSDLSRESFSYIFEQLSECYSVQRFGPRVMIKEPCGELHPAREEYCGQVWSKSVQDLFMVNSK